jgi:hypothetical protein
MGALAVGGKLENGEVINIVSRLIPQNYIYTGGP